MNSNNKKNPFKLFDDDNYKRISKLGKITRKNFDIFDLYNSESQEFIGKSLPQKRVNLFYIFILLNLLILLGKSFYLQILKGDYYQLLANKNRLKVTYLKTNRGLIYDRNGKLLVKNIPKFIITIIPSELPNIQSKRDNILKTLNDYIDIDINEVKRQLQNIKPNSLYYYRPILIKDNIDYEKAIQLKILISKLPGIYVQTDIKRKYLNENNLSLSHILGYIGKIGKKELDQDKEKYYLLTDYVGKSGLEKVYEKDLRGKHGVLKIEVDAYGQEKKVLEKQEKLLGNNLVLSIDYKIQSKLEEIIKEHLKKLNKTRASAVVLNPNNGEILALVSLPAYNNNDFSFGIDKKVYLNLIKNKDQPLFNRAISGEYPPGSTFKMIVASAALQEKIITEYTKFLSTGGIRIGKWFFPDWKIGGHGWVDVKKAIAQSVNTFFYIVGGGYKQFKGLGLNKIVYYAKKFGLGKRLNIDLLNESNGFIPTKEWKLKIKKEPWYIGDTYHLSIGQGYILVTPLQVAAFTSVIANNGILYQPHLVKQIINPNNNKIFTIKPKVLESNFIDIKNLKIVKQGLRQTVTNGSAWKLKNLPIKIAGKTGTAQWSKNKDPHAWFTSFAPYENPQIVLTILVEEGGEGSLVSVPIAKDFYEFWYKNYYKNH